jgi:imidazolonepropionase-like amidohydrolase
MNDAPAAARHDGRDRWRLPPVLLPDGEQRDLWIVGGRISDAAVDGADLLPGRFALPGLVDAHAHVSVAPVAYRPLDAADAAATLRALAGRGVLLVRDLGSPRSVTLEIVPGPDLPLFQVAGRVHAPRGRFYEALHDPVEPEALVTTALVEVARGARWVKVIADFRDPDLSYDGPLLASLVEAVHGAGARVAAHVQWSGVRDVVAAGVDSIEHGCSLDLATLDTMAAAGMAWTPTLTGFLEPLPPDAPPDRRALFAGILDNFRALLAPAAARGVTILAGTDLAGSLVDEIRHLVDFGLTPTQALRAATTNARTFLGAPALDAGGAADVVTFHDDPRDDPEVLALPAAVVLGGVRIA